MSPDSEHINNIARELKCFRALPELIRDCLNPPGHDESKAEVASLLAGIKLEHKAKFQRLMLLVGIDEDTDGLPFKINSHVESWADCRCILEHITGEDYGDD